MVRSPVDGLKYRFVGLVSSEAVVNEPVAVRTNVG
jgi:hypothetical protein